MRFEGVKARTLLLKKIGKNRRENYPPRVPPFTIESLVYSRNFTT
jgi:hypothetical protein